MIDHEIKDAIRKSWDLSSVKYDSCPGHGIGSDKEKNAWIQELNLFLPESKLKVLDAGCGTGAMAFLFAELGHQVTGIDLSKGMIAKAREKVYAQNLLIDLSRGDVECLPFKDRSFDVVINRHLIWTLPHPGIALNEWYRVLNKGGLLLIIDGIWMDKSFLFRTKRMLSDVFAKIFGNTHDGYYDKKLRSQLPYDWGVPSEALVSEFEFTGFTDIRFRDLMFIQMIQNQKQPWFRRFSPGNTYYLGVAIKKD